MIDIDAINLLDIGKTIGPTNGVLLYLRRTLSEASEEATHLPAPMKKGEAAAFLLTRA